MKKFTTLLLILLCLLFSTPVAAASVFKEGYYKVSDFKFSPDTNYTIQNISPNSVYVLVFNDNQTVIQSLRLEAKSPKFNLSSLGPNYTFVIVGAGEVSIS